MAVDRRLVLGRRLAWSSWLGRDWNHLVVPLVFLLLIGLFAVLNPNYLTYFNLVNVLRQISIVSVVTVGMSFVVFGGGFDLSAGSVVALAGTLGAMAMVETGSILVGVLVGIAVGIAVGLVNGFIVGYLHVSAFIVTLGTMYIARDLALLLSHGTAIYNLPGAYARMGNVFFLGFPLLVYMAALVFLVFHFVLNHTPYGMRVYAAGGNPTAARLSGVNVRRVTLANFVICSGLAGVAGMMLAARTGSGEPTAGRFYELEAIAAVVLGGAALSGGTGKLWRSMMGIALLGVLSNGLNILGVHHYWKGIVIGAVLLWAAALDRIRAPK